MSSSSSSYSTQVSSTINTITKKFCISFHLLDPHPPPLFLSLLRLCKEKAKLTCQWWLSSTADTSIPKLHTYFFQTQLNVSIEFLRRSSEAFAANWTHGFLPPSTLLVATASWKQMTKRLPWMLGYQRQLRSNIPLTVFNCKFLLLSNIPLADFDCKHLIVKTSSSQRRARCI